MAGMKDSRTAPQPPVPATDRELILETALTLLVHDAQTAQTMASSSDRWARRVISSPTPHLPERM